MAKKTSKKTTDRNTVKKSSAKPAAAPAAKGAAASPAKSARPAAPSAKTAKASNVSTPAKKKPAAAAPVAKPAAKAKASPAPASPARTAPAGKSTKATKAPKSAPATKPADNRKAPAAATKAAAKPAPVAKGKTKAREEAAAEPVKPRGLVQRTSEEIRAAPLKFGGKKITRPAAAAAPAKPARKKDNTPHFAPGSNMAAIQANPPLPAPAVDASGKRKKVSSGLKARDLDYFRQLLLEKRHELVGDMRSMEHEALRSTSGSNLSNLPVHMADMGTDNYEQEFTLGLVEKDRELLREINTALQKIVDGTYGICEGTGNPIGRPRLEAQPWARYSIEYARQMEKSRYR